MDSILKIWIAVCIIAAVVDILTSGFLFVWFSIGAGAAIAVYFLGGSVITQALVFIIVSLICLAIGYPLAKKFIKKSVKRLPLMEEKYIGKEMIAEENLNDTSKAKVGGIYWTIKNVGHPILKGDKFIVTGIEGNKLLVRKED